MTNGPGYYIILPYHAVFRILALRNPVKTEGRASLCMTKATSNANVEQVSKARSAVKQAGFKLASVMSIVQAKALCKPFTVWNITAERRKETQHFRGDWKTFLVVISKKKNSVKNAVDYINHFELVQCCATTKVKKA